MVEEDADQHLHHFTVELKGELRRQDQLETEARQKNTINIQAFNLKAFLSSFCTFVCMKRLYKKYAVYAKLQFNFKQHYKLQS